MSHYWSMHGSIILSAPLLEGLTEDIRGYIEEDHLTLEENIITVSGNDNHFPSRLECMFIALDGIGIKVLSGFGNYHAEDDMAGEWEVQGNEIVIQEYSGMVEKLRSACSAAKEELEALWSFYGKGLEVANWHLNGDLEPLDHFFESNSCDALDKLKEALGE